MIKKIGISSLIFVFASLILIAGGIFYYEKTFTGKIYKNVSLFGEDLTGKNVTELVKIITEKQATILNNEITLKSGTKEIKVKLADTGVGYDSQKIAQECFNVGRDKSFPAKVAKASKTLFTQTDIGAYPKINKAKFDNFVLIAVDQLNNDPVDASLKIENGAIVEVASQNGVVVDSTILEDKISEAFITNSLSKPIILTSQSTEPTIKSIDFAAAKNSAALWLNKNLVFKYEDKSYTPTKNDIGNWIDFDNNNGQISSSLNDSNIKAYLNKISNNFVVTKIDRKVNDSDNSVIQEGREGKYLNSDQALGDTKNAMNATGNSEVILTTNTVAPNEIRVAKAQNDVELNRFEGKYIDVSLKNQQLCRVDSGQLIACYVISSGKASMPTPTGTFHITSKSPRQFSNKYKMWMPWWEQFSGDYGLHELPETDTWKEVPDHLGTPISHGCVRLGVGPAEEVYNWTEIGTPVYIHQ